MKKIIVALILSLAVSFPVYAAERSKMWEQVDKAMQKGLPRTAVEHLDKIIPTALADQAYGEVAKAIARKIVLEGNIEGNKPEEKIVRMEAEIEAAPNEIKALLTTVQANWYWHYFLQNKWRFMRRTATAEAPGKDFTTWDLPRLFAEIDKVFTKALAASEQLKQMQVSQFDDLLQKGSMSDSYRPTLYDFVAQDALKFYTSGEQAAAKAQDAYELAAKSPIFDNANEFLAWSHGPELKKFPDSPITKAIKLYGELMSFHEEDEDLSAFLDLDLARLVYGNNIAFGEEKAERYKAALQAFVDKWADHEVSAMALYHWARALQAEGELVTARKLAQRGKNAHRETVGGKMCHNLIADIESKMASISVERVWNAGLGFKPARETALPTINVYYKNVTEVHFRAVAWDWHDFLSRKHRRPTNLNDAERKQLLARKPALKWSQTLPATNDYKERVEVIPAPSNLKAGHYFLIASHDPKFGDTDNQVSYTPFWVSELSLVVRTREGRIEGFVLNANSGAPVKGAEVKAWYIDRNYQRIADPVQSTDKNGFFSFEPSQRKGYLVRARHAGREVALENEMYWNRKRRQNVREQTVFFTDRTLYRPGQTIQYKGILMRVDAENDNYKPIGARRVTVRFLDPNNKEVAKAECRSNDYGSFSGSFTAPRDRLMGRYQISSALDGRAWINVEEYKRPKFQVTLEAPKTAPRLNDKVIITGKAEAYTGAAIDDAQVKWRVVREVRWPVWWGWYSWRRPNISGSQEIAHGVLRTGSDGSFQVEFTAKPDSKVSEKDEVSFTYTVYADVTDGAGETRSDSQGVNVGFVALRANLQADDWQTASQPVKIKVQTTTLDGEAQLAEGVVKIHRLKAPAYVHRQVLARGYWRPKRDGQEIPDLSNPNNWELGAVATEQSFTTNGEGIAQLQFSLGVGVYRAMLESQDRFGKTVTARLPIQVVKPDDPKLAFKIPHLLAAPQWSLEPGDEFIALWGTGYQQGRACVEIEHRHEILQRFWTTPDRTQQTIKQAVTEAMRGGFTLRVTQVRENRAYFDVKNVEVPWSNKDFDLKWEHLVSKLQPGQKETWTLKISRAQADKTASDEAVASSLKEAAEMVATLYDASLDQFKRHDWMKRFNIFYRNRPDGYPTFANSLEHLRHIRGHWARDHVGVSRSYRHFPPDLVANFMGYGWVYGRRSRAMARGGAVVYDAAPMMTMSAPAKANSASLGMEMADAEMAPMDQNGAGGYGGGGAAGGGAAQAQGPDLSQVTARKNLNETAFFFPQLTSDAQGVVRMTFSMPEALTTWRFMGFAHDQQLRSGFLEGEAITSKDIMVQPNPPRFLREGDILEFTVKVSNQSAARQTGKVRLSFADALTEKAFDQQLGNKRLTQNFDIPSKESRSFSWRIKTPDGAPFLTYKAVAATSRLSDGEEGYLPVLSRRILVTESLPLPIRVKAGQGQVTKRFKFTKLLESGRSDTLVHQNLVAQMVSNPAWYAVLALPYLMEFPHECTEQTFNRLYANSVARYIAQSDPKIRRIFDQWKNTPALDSPLEKNQDLKMLMLEETPWLRQAKNESEARRNVGILFDDNRLNYELEKALRKLREAQLGDGAWPWFPGGYRNDYITLYITTGFGRLRHLGVNNIDISLAVRALQRLDQWMDERYRRILNRPNPEKYVPSPTDALYLYCRSFFLKDRPIPKNNQDAVKFYLGQARKFWLKLANRQSQGHLAIALKRFNGIAPFSVRNDSTPTDIMRSIKQRSVSNEEMGMFWRDLELSWWWFRAPIETQALMIEAFDEVLGDKDAVEECRVWLLKQKQTQDWKTTKATADAVYALLLRGADILASDQLVELVIGGVNVTPGKTKQPNRQRPEPGTGFYETRFTPTEITPKLGNITVTKLDEGVAWGSVHWQYLEDMRKVTAYEGTPLKLQKALYTKMNTKRGKELKPVKGKVAVGDELVVRIILRVDRDMEYVHMKDHRGSGVEPVNVISRYRYQDGLAYYESTRDTASHFYIDYLPKGTYVFEYSTRVQHRGEYQTGMAAIQCMYAPEFNSHSESLPLVVK
jgi:hypothetical protein